MKTSGITTIRFRTRPFWNFFSAPESPGQAPPAMLAGFGPDHHLHTTRILRLMENLPIRIEFVDSAEKVEEILPKLSEMVGAGLMEMHDTTVIKIASPPQSR